MNAEDFSWGDTPAVKLEAPDGAHDFTIGRADVAPEGDQVHRLELVFEAGDYELREEPRFPVRRVHSGLLPLAAETPEINRLTELLAATGLDIGERGSVEACVAGPSGARWPGAGWRSSRPSPRR